MTTALQGWIWTFSQAVPELFSSCWGCGHLYRCVWIPPDHQETAPSRILHHSEMTGGIHLIWSVRVCVTHYMHAKIGTVTGLTVHITTEHFIRQTKVVLVLQLKQGSTLRRERGSSEKCVSRNSAQWILRENLKRCAVQTETGRGAFTARPPPDEREPQQQVKHFGSHKRRSVAWRSVPTFSLNNIIHSQLNNYVNRRSKQISKSPETWTQDI